LESYHPYLLPQAVSKTPTTLGTYGSLPKIRKGRFGSLRPLGVKIPNLYSLFKVFSISKLFQLNMDSIMERLILERWPIWRWNMKRPSNSFEWHYWKDMSCIFYIVT
jgi:hypothetical protein